MIRKLEGHEPHLKTVLKSSSDLTNLINYDKGDSSRITFETDSIHERFKSIRTRLNERKNSLEKTTRVLLQFTTIIRQTDEWCVTTVQEINELAPVSKDPEEAKKQSQIIDVSL